MIFKKKEPEEIKCNHIYGEYIRMLDYKRMCNTLHLKCVYCGEVTTVNITNGLMNDLYLDIHVNGIKLR